MADFERASGDARLLDGKAPGQPLESFITATVVALAEMANTEVAVREIYRATFRNSWGDISAVLGIKSAAEGTLVLCFPEQTAAGIAERVFADTEAELNESLIRDCVGEIANVIAGQAKTLLTGTPHQLTFSLPEVVVGNRPESRIERGRECLVIAFRSDRGEFSLGLALER